MDKILSQCFINLMALWTKTTKVHFQAKWKISYVGFFMYKHYSGFLRHHCQFIVFAAYIYKKNTFCLSNHSVMHLSYTVMSVGSIYIKYGMSFHC